VAESADLGRTFPSHAVCEDAVGEAATSTGETFGRGFRRGRETLAEHASSTGETFGRGFRRGRETLAEHLGRETRAEPWDTVGETRDERTFGTLVLRVVGFLAILLGIGPIAVEVLAADRPAARNVIVLIVDGCSSEQYTLARWFKGAPLATDEICVGMVKTHISDSVVADSAPAATAYATGIRTSDKFIGLGPKPGTLANVPEPDEDLRYRPLATVLEGARLLGKATGIVATARLTHATPAAYVAHVPSRSQEDDIMEQAVYQNVDVVLGGGGQHLVPEGAGGERPDREDLAAVLRRRGYQLPKTRSELAQVTSGKLFGTFATSHLAPEIDRSLVAPEEPTLEQMARKAIELLSQDPDGFFLMVEASQVDWACHAHDPAHMLSDLLMYDRAVAAAMEFARKDGNTLVLALPDHNTGGMSIGNRRTDKTYSQMTTEALLEPLRKMKLSAPGMWKMLGTEKTPQKIQAVVREYWGLEITEEDAKHILAVADRDEGNPHNGFGEVLCPKYTCLGWTTHGHCGGDVPLGAFGPGQPVGLLDGPEIAGVTARALGLDLGAATRRLFVEAGKAFADGKVTVDKTDARNPVVRIECRGKTSELPVNKNLLRIGDQTTELEGVVVYVPKTEKVYLPQQAVDGIRAAVAESQDR